MLPRGAIGRPLATPGSARGGRGELRDGREAALCQNLRGREGVNTRYYTVMLYVSLTGTRVGRAIASLLGRINLRSPERARAT